MRTTMSSERFLSLNDSDILAKPRIGFISYCAWDRQTVTRRTTSPKNIPPKHTLPIFWLHTYIYG